MRELKFRAFNSQTKQMLPVTFTAVCSVDTVLGLYKSDDKNIFDIWGLPAWKYITIMQFTGLKDKNGKEIYEGDIVRFYFCADHPLAASPEEDGDITEMIDSVQYIDGAFYFTDKDVGGGAFIWRFNERCKVIGNIYENPELLKE